MAKRSIRNSKIVLKADGVYRVDEADVEELIAEPIEVTAFGTAKMKGDKIQAYTEVRFKDRKGAWKKELLPSSMLSAQQAQFIARLAEQGYMWPAEQSAIRRIVGELSISKPNKHINIVWVPGWHNGAGKTFVLPKRNYTAVKGDRKAFRLVGRHTVELAPYIVRGTLEEWQDKIATAGKLSSRARTAIAAGFTAPNLRPLRMDSFGLNFSGESSSGKSLLSYLLASVAGLNADGGPPNWGGTPAGFEQRALGYRDCAMPLDDLSHVHGHEGQVAQMVKLVTFLLAGNRPKTRAGQYANANQLVDEDWRVVTISTSEDAFWKDQSGGIRGEAVPMINIRACVSEAGDIFDSQHATENVGQSLDKRIAFVEQQKALCLELQGTAFRAYLRRRVRDNAAEKALKDYTAEFSAAARLPGNARALGRIRQNFAVIYASAAQAIDYGILPWQKKATLRDIKACFDDAVAQLSATRSPVTASAKPTEDALVREFKAKLSTAKFIDRKSASAKQLNAAAGIKRTSEQGKVEYLLFASTMKEWFPDVTTRKRVTAALAARGLLKTGRRKDTRTVQTKLAALKRKVACFAIKRSKVLTYAA
jgi:putative DNA primase/helicase